MPRFSANQMKIATRPKPSSSGIERLRRSAVKKNQPRPNSTAVAHARLLSPRSRGRTTSSMITAAMSMRTAEVPYVP